MVVRPRTRNLGGRVVMAIFSSLFVLGVLPGKSVLLGTEEFLTRVSQNIELFGSWRVRIGFLEELCSIQLVFTTILAHCTPVPWNSSGRLRASAR